MQEEGVKLNVPSSCSLLVVRILPARLVLVGSGRRWGERVEWCFAPGSPFLC